ncbi:hypothetical protein [Lysinibacillus pakistanensis]|uniref:Uncharacterized protein n=1 Tax=Lysinibacillus pakistanensis TaxID=759811 RepID=A0ABX6DDX8_9BACI|nr:hypothetical protein GDS87_09520 [Lysinibacillus pakistanensis]
MHRHNPDRLLISIDIISTGNKAVIDNVPMHVAVEIKKAIENYKAIQKETSSAPAVAPKEKDMYDVADEIRELKDLLDAGILI